MASIISRPILKITDSESFRFTTAMLSAEITFLNLNTTALSEVTKKLAGLKLKRDSFTISTTTFTTTIDQILNNKTAYLHDKIFVSVATQEYGTDDEYFDIELENLPSAFTIVYNNPPALIQTQKTKSFAKINVRNLKTFSGELDTVEIYTRPTGTTQRLGVPRKKRTDTDSSIQQYKLISTQDAVATEFFVSASGEPFSYLDSTHKLNNAFITSSYSGVTLTTSAFQTFQTSSDYQSDGFLVALNYSNSDNLYKNYSKITLNPQISFLPDNEYVLSFDIRGKKVNSLEFETGIEIYASGSAFDNKNISNAPNLKKTLLNSGYDVQSNYIFGEFLGKFNIPVLSTTRDFGSVLIDLKPRISGSGNFVLILNWGTWDIANVSITPKNKEELTFYIPIKEGLEKNRKERLDFQFVFKNPDGIKNSTIIEAKDIIFDGENDVVEGGNNLLAGSMYIGGTIGSGIQMAGVASGFIRSVGYTGYESASLGIGKPGFMLYSGSTALSSVISASDNYEGIGLELHAGGNNGRLRFKASGSNSIFEVITKSFFVGTGSAQFISGANSNIEISSSNFHLQPNGNVTMQGTITATAGNIGGFSITSTAISSSNNSLILRGDSGQITGSTVLFTGGKIAGWTIVGNKLSGSNATLDAEGAALYMSSKAPGSDSVSAFDILADEYYIDFTPAEGQTRTSKYFVKFGPNFAVSSSGVLIASGAVFEGTITASAGLIGGWTIESDRIQSAPDGLRLYGAGNSGYYISSSNFKVTSDGNITGSQVLFTGGKIAGWDVSSDALSNVTVNISSSAGGKIILGNNPSTQTRTSGTGFYVSGAGDFRVGSGTGNRIEFDGTNIVVSASSFLVGNLATAFISGSGNNIRISSSNFDLNNGNVTASNVALSGNITATTGNIGGFAITADAITGSGIFISGSPLTGGVDDPRYKFISTTNFNVKQNGDITGSKVLFTGGTIGGFDLNTVAIKSTNNNLILSSSGQITGSTVLFTGGKIASFNLSNDALTAITFGDGIQRFFISSSVPALSSDLPTSYFISSSRFNIKQNGDVTGSNVLFTGGKIAGFTLSGNKLENDPYFYLDGGATADQLFISSSKFKVTAVGDISGSNVNFTGGTIGGWTIGSNSLLASGILLTSTGSIRSIPFSSGATGWEISSDGTAEFMNAIIRGTLATTVFEKNVVSAVGGQVIVANATTITGSISANSTTMLVANAGGIVPNEIFIAKATGSTGFTLEYFQINTVNTGSDPHTLTVTRGLNQGTIGGISSSYTDGQVIVSTGTVGSGFILINAAPSGSSLYGAYSPFIDVTQRTGSAPYDIKVKARLGNLEGIADGLYGNLTGYGLYSENVYLTGGIKATFGEIAGFAITSSFISSSKKLLLESSATNPKFRFGFSGIDAHIVTSASKGVYIDGEGTFNFSQNDNDDYLRGKAGLIEIRSKNFILSSSNLVASSPSQKIILGGTLTTKANDILFGSITAPVTPHIFLSGSGDFEVVGSPSSFFRHVVTNNTGSFVIKTTNFDLQATDITASSNNGGYLQLRNAALLSSTSLPGIVLSGSGEFSLVYDSNNYLRRVGTSLDIKSTTFNLQATDITASSAAGGLISLKNGVTKNSGTGIFLSGSGEFNLQTDTNDYIRKTGTALEISSTDFSLSGSTTLVIDTNKIVLGASSQTQTRTSGTGFYVSGGGDFRVGKSDGARIEFDGTSTLILSSSTFLIGVSGSATGAYISGSGGSLEISSSGFHLTRNGNATLSGTIKASAGTIGGFNISSDAISGTGIFISGSPIAGGADTTTSRFISTTNFNVKQNGDVTGSKVLFTGGKIASFNFDAAKFSDTTSTNAVGTAGTVLTNFSLYSSKGTIIVGGDDHSNYNPINSLSGTATGSSPITGLVMGLSSAELTVIGPAWGGGSNAALKLYSSYAYTTSTGHSYITYSGKSATATCSGSIAATLVGSYLKTDTASDIRAAFTMNRSPFHIHNGYYSAADEQSGTFRLGDTTIGGGSTLMQLFILNAGSYSSNTYSHMVLNAYEGLQFGATNTSWATATSTGDLGASLDTKLYRSAANTLKTDGAFVVAGQVAMGSAATIGSYGLKILGSNPSGIISAGQAYDWFITSDARKKENINTIENSLELTKKLRGVTFDWISDSKHDFGLIAQEVECVIPEFVSTDSDGMKSVSYGRVVSVLIEAIKDQQNQIDNLTLLINQEQLNKFK